MVEIQKFTPYVTYFFWYNQYNHQAWLVWCKKWQTDDGQAAHDDYPLNAANPMPW